MLFYVYTEWFKNGEEMEFYDGGILRKDEVHCNKKIPRGKTGCIALFAQKYSVFHCNPNITSVHNFNKNKDNLTNFSIDLPCLCEMQ